MSRVTIVLLIILVILVGVLIALYFIGKRLQARQEQSDEQIQAMKQPQAFQGSGSQGKGRTAVYQLYL